MAENKSNNLVSDSDSFEDDEYYYDYYYDEYYYEELEDNELNMVNVPSDVKNVQVPKSNEEPVTLKATSSAAELTDDLSEEMRVLKAELNIAEKKLAYYQQTENTNKFLSEQNLALTKQVSELEQALDVESDEEGAISNARAAELSAKQARIDELENLLEQLVVENKKLEDELTQSGKAIASPVAKESGYSKEEIAEVMLSAKRTANEMLAEAEEKLRIAGQKQAQIVEDIRQMRTSLLEQKNTVQHYLDELEK